MELQAQPPNAQHGPTPSPAEPSERWWVLGARKPLDRQVGSRSHSLSMPGGRAPLEDARGDLDQREPAVGLDLVVAGAQRTKVVHAGLAVPAPVLDGVVQVARLSPHAAPG